MEAGKSDKEIIIHYNKMFAEFMGYKYYPFVDDAGIKQYNPGWKKYKEGHNFTKMNRLQFKDEEVYLCRNNNQLAYRTDWEWLMPVVEKIETLRSVAGGHFGVHISSNSCSIQDTKLHLALEGKIPFVYFNETVHDTKRTATWEEVAKFISWWNNSPDKILYEQEKK